MNWGSPEFVILIVAISTGGWLVNNWIRARHGYPLEDEWGGKTDRANDDKARALADENRELREKLADAGKIEQRLRVLERIATDKGTALTAQIEALREPSAS